MLDSIRHLTGATLVATDGEIGHVKQAYFDDRSWTLRYLIVETGSWLNGREVLISPYAVKQPQGPEHTVHVALTRAQVQGSPTVDTMQPVSRQHEREFLQHHGHPEYWDGEFRPHDVHLRSTAHVTGYEIQATDHAIGRITDFVFDDTSWAIRYLVVDTSAWWQGGHPVLIGMHWCDRIDWATQQVHVRLTREQVRSSPVFTDVAAIHRDYEMRLHQNYQRQGYWL